MYSIFYRNNDHVIWVSLIIMPLKLANLLSPAQTEHTSDLQTEPHTGGKSDENDGTEFIYVPLRGLFTLFI